MRTNQTAGGAARPFMSPETHFAAVFLRTARMIDALLDGAPPGIVLSIDIGNSFLDFIASGAAASKHTLIGAPSLHRYRSLLWDYRRPLKPADIIGEPPLFGRVDGVTRSLDDLGEMKRHTLGGGDVVTRRIDSWIKSRARLCLLSLGDPYMALDQIDGAEDVLARDRPIVTLYPGTQDSAAAWQRMVSLGYEGLDLQSKAGHLQTTLPDDNFAWLFVPAEMPRDALFEAMSVADIDLGVSTVSVGWNEMDRNAMPRQRRSSQIFGLAAIPLPELHRTFGISEIVSGNDCYPLETDGTSSWRWLGPRPRARLSVPCAFPGLYRFEVGVLSTRVPQGLEGCRVLVEGREVPAVARGGGERGKLTFVGHLDAAGYGGCIELDLINSGPAAPAGADPRTLRMSVGSVALSPCQ